MMKARRSKRRRGTSPRSSIERRARAPLVLVVDDAEDSRDLYASYLNFSGFRTKVAVDGIDALTQIRRERPNLIVMDLAMPRLDGWEVLRQIRANPRTSDLVVIVITGQARPPEIARARDAGANAVRTKPCLPHVLLALVREYLGDPRAGNDG